MAMIPRSMGSMRITALPLIRPVSGAWPTRKLPIFYGYKIIAPPPIKKTSTPRGGFARWLPEDGLGKWASHKANQTWTGFGLAPAGTVKQRAFQLGERLMDQLDFEESNLKALDLSSAPPPKLNGQSVETATDAQVPLVYPPSVLSGPQSLDHLKALVEERIPLHNRGLATWIFFAILSAPLKLIPIIPNFPFYFCAWRSWSHWKARRSAQYIQGLIQSNRIVPIALPPLDCVYDADLSDTKSGVVPREELELAARILTLEPEETKELLRAHEQVLSRVLEKSEKKTL
ncbi:mitochondrial K+-H+ exchange-related-domain-containing protein [Mycena alexandri]|uniref:Mitochondrial K+-H+ exchange-related-domain-containing protein n=1 Tax=Mycena alexandri TaxID=1745969 RepID=A0AAD6TF46_9AGAR|nr:mitochondrial K+-H+ exchange-related-domain-containing protein [Mycena alexandri]